MFRFSLVVGGGKAPILLVRHSTHLSFPGAWSSNCFHAQRGYFYFLEKKNKEKSSNSITNPKTRTKLQKANSLCPRITCLDGFTPEDPHQYHSDLAPKVVGNLLGSVEILELEDVGVTIELLSQEVFLSSFAS
jgi:hypothetical protein